MKIRNITEWIIEVVKYPYRLSELYGRDPQALYEKTVNNIKSLLVTFLELQLIVPAFQHGFQTGFSITICINEKFL